MKATTIKFAGEKFYMAMTAEAMFSLKELFGGEMDIGKIQPDTEEARACLYRAVSILMENAELARRFMGYDKGYCLTESEIKAMASPEDILMLKFAVVEAIELGYGREIKDPKKEIDLVLQKLEKKTV